MCIGKRWNLPKFVDVCWCPIAELSLCWQNYIAMEHDLSIAPLLRTLHHITLSYIPLPHNLKQYIAILPKAPTPGPRELGKLLFPFSLDLPPQIQTLKYAGMETYCWISSVVDMTYINCVQICISISIHYYIYYICTGRYC